jgi:nifR3 family TIM-barrel protein
MRSVQLYGVDPAVMGAAVQRLVGDIGVDHIDLNFGCPAAKVTRKGGGAALPLHRVLFRNVVRAAVTHAGSVPVTIKMRIGLDDEHRSAVPSARIAVDEGVAAVALHARTAEQHYAGRADWEAIGELKAAVDEVPVLGNGDIWEAPDATDMMAATGCDGVVIGRGCLGRPWLFADLAAHFAGLPLPATPLLGRVTEVMRTHARYLVEEMGPDRGMRQMRKHTGWYLTGYPVGGASRRVLAQVSTTAEFDTLLAQLDPDLALPDEARRIPRGHTNGPIAVALPPGWLDNLDDPTPPQGADALVSGG